MLLRLERFPCRLNYAKGILEARVQRYKHLKNLLVRFMRPGLRARTYFSEETFANGDTSGARARARKPHPGHSLRCQPLHWGRHVL